jgi:hypothetical protein
MIIGISMLPLLNVQLTPSRSLLGLSVSYRWLDASARVMKRFEATRLKRFESLRASRLKLCCLKGLIASPFEKFEGFLLFKTFLLFGTFKTTETFQIIETLIIFAFVTLKHSNHQTFKLFIISNNRNKTNNRNILNN